MSGVRIAMWSGPRNISTAMMRSWGARTDAAVLDEPFYAHYLAQTGLEHPGADEVMRSQPTSADAVIEQITGPIPGGCAIWYQKHMAHHLLPSVDRGWIAAMRTCLLVREPRAMLASLARVLREPTAEETGLPQQVELMEWIRAETGEAPPVLVARDVLEDPRGTLAALCERLGVGFDERMLAWEPGPRDTDGVWAPHWYASVERSTGFEPYAHKEPAIPEHLRDVLARCEELYERLAPHRLAAG